MKKHVFVIVVMYLFFLLVIQMAGCDKEGKTREMSYTIISSGKEPVSIKVLMEPGVPSYTDVLLKEKEGSNRQFDIVNEELKISWVYEGEDLTGILDQNLEVSRFGSAHIQEEVDSVFIALKIIHISMGQRGVDEIKGTFSGKVMYSETGEIVDIESGFFDLGLVQVID